MRVRYQMAGQTYTAVCDLTDKKAVTLFRKVCADGRCEWAELVGEDDDNYMEILDAYDNPMAMKLYRIMKELFG